MRGKRRGGGRGGCYGVGTLAEEVRTRRGTLLLLGRDLWWGSRGKAEGPRRAPLSVRPAGYVYGYKSGGGMGSTTRSTMVARGRWWICRVGQGEEAV